MFEECQGDKFEFINKLTAIGHETKYRVQTRLQYEIKIMKIWEEGKTLEEEKEAWNEYIGFEIKEKMFKRAKLLYERGIIPIS